MTSTRGHSDTTTEGVRVRVAAQYMPEHSDPGLGKYLFTYRVTISNDGEERVKLISRHWIIRDSENNLEEVRGPGVIGEQPELAPGETFEYKSHCPLETPWGTMEGSFQMIREGGDAMFDVAIGRFFLARTTDPIDPGIQSAD